MNLNEKIAHIPDCEVFLEKDLTALTTFRLKSVGDLIEVKTILALQKVVKILNEEKIKYLVVGWGANQILPPKCDGYILHLKFEIPDSSITELKEEYELPASISLSMLTSLAVKYGLRGWEVFTGIPASLGGAIFMNAGTNLGEIGPLIKTVSLVTTTGLLRTEIINDDSFSYRHNNFVKPGEIIIGATLTHGGADPEIPGKIKEYLEYRKKTQPLATKNCGCVFKNPNKEMQAGRLIDSLGLKGLQIENLRVSPKHANFIENLGAADWNQFQTLISVIQAQMDMFYGIEFELEVKIPYH